MASSRKLLLLLMCVGVLAGSGCASKRKPPSPSACDHRIYYHGDLALLAALIAGGLNVSVNDVWQPAPYLSCSSGRTLPY